MRCTSAGKEIRGIDVEVKSQQAKRENFENILTFLASQRVRTSTVTPRDLANGNLKSLMRLILSLASHYKPHSVKQGRADSQQGKRHSFTLQKRRNGSITRLLILSFCWNVHQLHSGLPTRRQLQIWTWLLTATGSSRQTMPKLTPLKKPPIWRRSMHLPLYADRIIIIIPNSALPPRLLLLRLLSECWVSFTPLDGHRVQSFIFFKLFVLQVNRHLQPIWSCRPTFKDDSPWRELWVRLTGIPYSSSSNRLRLEAFRTLVRWPICNSSSNTTVTTTTITINSSSSSSINNKWQA